MARNAIVVCEVFLDMSLISRDIFLDPVEFEQRIHIKTTRQMIQTPRATANPKTKATQALKKSIRFLYAVVKSVRFKKTRDHKLYVNEVFQVRLFNSRLDRS